MPFCYTMPLHKTCSLVQSKLLEEYFGYRVSTRFPSASSFFQRSQVNDTGSIFGRFSDHTYARGLNYILGLMKQCVWSRFIPEWDIYDTPTKGKQSANWCIHTHNRSFDHSSDQFWIFTCYDYKMQHKIINCNAICWLLPNYLSP